MDLDAGLTRISLAVATLAFLAHASIAHAADPQVGQTVVQSGPSVASDVYAFGGGVDIEAAVEGDLVAGGGRVVTGGRVRGNLIAVAGSIVAGGTVARSVRAAGGAVTISSHVGRNLNVGGGAVILTPEAVIDGRARVVGGEVRVAGTVKRKLYAVGAVVVLAGEFLGDVELVAQEIEVLQTARIHGRLTYWSPRDAKIDRKATIQGPVTHNLPELPPALAQTGAALVTVSRLLFMIGLIVTAVALYLLFPRFIVLASHTIGSDPFRSLGVGLLLFAVVPAAAILIMLTILGIPLGLVLFALYFGALLVGFLVTAFHLGDLGARAFSPRGRRSRSLRVAWLVLALAVLALLNQVPLVGGVAMAAAVLLGLGAVSLHTWRHWGDPEPPTRR